MLGESSEVAELEQAFPEVARLEQESSEVAEPDQASSGVAQLEQESSKVAEPDQASSVVAQPEQESNRSGVDTVTMDLEHFMSVSSGWDHFLNRGLDSDNFPLPHSDDHTDRRSSHFSYSRTLIFEVFTRQLERISVFRLPSFMKCLRSTVSALTLGNTITCSSGCSGTEVYHLANGCFNEAVYRHFGYSVPQWRNQLAGENDVDKQKFIARQHPLLEILTGDIQEWQAPTVMNLLQDRPCQLPFTETFYGGFSCEDLGLCKLNRKMLRGGQRNGTGTTGKTYRMMRDHILRVRPKISILENVPALGRDYVEECMTQNDLRYIEDEFSSNDMTVFSAAVDRKRYDSPHDGVRQWLAIVDIHPDLAKPFEQTWRSLLDNMQCPFDEARTPAHRCLFDEDVAERLMEGVHCRPGRDQSKCDWKDYHEQAFQLLELPWPPPVADTISSARLFRERELEVIWCANEKFPAAKPPVGTVYDFFDANMTFERVFRHVDKDRSKISNPWHSFVPYLSGNSVIVVRSMSSKGVLKIWRLLGWEAFKLQGWDSDMWLHDAEMEQFARDKFGHTELLTNMAANMWSLFQFLPVLTATLACMPLEELMEQHRSLMTAKKAKTTQVLNVSSDDSADD